MNKNILVFNKLLYMASLCASDIQRRLSGGELRLLDLATSKWLCKFNFDLWGSAFFTWTGQIPFQAKICLKLGWFSISFVPSGYKTKDEIQPRLNQKYWLVCNVQCYLCLFKMKWKSQSVPCSFWRWHFYTPRRNVKSSHSDYSCYHDCSVTRQNHLILNNQGPFECTNMWIW